MAKDHGRMGARVLRVIDITGRTKKRQDEERNTMQDRHAHDRSQLVSDHRELKATTTAELENRYEIMRKELKAAHAPDFKRLADQQAKAEIEADRQRQMRAAEREAAEQKTEQAIARAEKLYRDMQKTRGRERGLDYGR